MLDHEDVKMIMDMMFLLVVVMLMVMMPTWRGMVAWSGVRKEFQ